jgi:hypothetical protein
MMSDDGDADVIDLRAEQVLAVAFGMHPFVVNLPGAMAESDVFFNEAEVNAGL